MGAVGLVEGLADRGGDNNVLAAGDMRERVSDPVNAAPLPVRAFLRTGGSHALTLEDPGDGGLEAGMGRGGAQNRPGDGFAAEC